MTAATRQQTVATEASAQQPIEQIPTSVVTLEEVCTAVVRETHCTTAEAESMVAWVKGFVERARLAGYRTQFPTDAQMAGRDYAIFDELMPHGSAAVPGSAHDVLERHVLDPVLGETSLWHDTEYDRRGERYYCTVKVALGVIR